MNFPVCYAVIHKNSEVREASRSGGIFTALSNEILELGGVVYGCVLDEKMNAVHVRADSIPLRDKMRGSKYVQSATHPVYEDVERDLCSGKQVLFTGTSCQIAGVHGFLKRDYTNLLCVDLVCHGVPSPKVFEDYVKWQESKNSAKCIDFNFRNKKDFGWHAHVETLLMKRRSGKIKEVHSQIYTTLFYGHSILRPACYYCPYKSILHPSDITIADLWGVEKAAPRFNDDKGTSLVLINTDKGVEAFDSVKDKLFFEVCDLNDCMQPPLQAPFDKPSNREEFWIDYANLGFQNIAVKYGGYTRKMRIKHMIKTIMGRKI